MYFLILFLTFGTAIGCSHSTNNNIKMKRGIVTVPEMFFAIIAALILLTIAFRSPAIGVDSAQYVNRYNIVHNTSWSDVIFMRGNSRLSEPLFIYLNKALSSVFGDFGQIVLVEEAFFLYFGYLKTIKKYSMNVFISLMCFFGFGVYSANINLLRQTLAICVCTFALKYIFEKSAMKFYAIVGLACLIHFSAIFFLIAYFVSNQLKCTRINTVLILGGGITAALMMNMLQSFFSTFFPRWNGYINVERHAGGYIAFLIFFLFTSLVLLERKRIMQMSFYAPALINLNNIHMAIWIMRMVTRNVERISYYYVIAPILLMPYLMKAISNRIGYKCGLLFKYAVMLLLSLYFVHDFINEKALYPYAFMWGNLL